MKGLSSFVIKSMIIIAAIISITYILNQMLSFQAEVSDKSKMFDYSTTAYHILDILTSDQCLGVNMVDPNMSKQKIIDYKKIKEFSEIYNDTEPDCAKNYEYGYSIRIEKFKWNWTSTEVKTNSGIPFGNRDVGLSFDTSGSMNGDNKITQAKKAAEALVDCMDDSDRLTVITYSGCSAPVSIPLTPIKSNRNSLKSKISVFQATGSTPILQSLDSTLDELYEGQNPPENKEPYNNQSPLIIIMTDGGQNCGYDTSSYNEIDKRINKMVDMFGEKIPVYTVGFTVEPNDEAGKFLEYMADHSGGKAYFVNSGDEMKNVFCSLVKKTNPPPPEEYQEWDMGINMSDEIVSIGSGNEKFITGLLNASIPVIIKFSGNKIYPGKISITLYRGSIFELSGMIEHVCNSKNSIQKYIDINYRTYTQKKNGNNYICQKDGNNEFCRKIKCKNLESFDIKPGYYYIIVKKTDNFVKVIT